MQQCSGKSCEQQCNSAVKRVASSSATVQWRESEAAVQVQWGEWGVAVQQRSRDRREQQCNSAVGRVGSSSAQCSGESRQQQYKCSGESGE